MNKPHRYSDDIPYDKRRYWYFTLHGLGPNTIPKDLKILESRDGLNDKGTKGLYICLDGILNTSELKEFDLKELTPPEEEKSIEQIIEEYLKDKGWCGMLEGIWEEPDGIHIYVIEGDWKHQHKWLEVLMEEFGYIQTDEIEEPSDNDAYTSEHIFVKK